MCWYCGVPILDREPLGRSLRCQQCGRDLRVCRHCRHFTPGSRGDCNESQAELVADKERGNFCDWFALDTRYGSAFLGSPIAAETQDRRRAFENLFTP